MNARASFAEPLDGALLGGGVEGAAALLRGDLTADLARAGAQLARRLRVPTPAAAVPRAGEGRRRTMPFAR